MKPFNKVNLDITYSIAVRGGGCFQLVPISGGTHPRRYYRPDDIESDYRKLIDKYGADNVKIFREIEVILQED